jgi:Protein of unknown function (DUF3617).
MKLRPVVSCCAVALLCAPALVLAEPGYEMQMVTTVKMQLPSGAMPPQTHTGKVCTSAKKPDMRNMMKGNRNCTISDYKRAGDTVSYHTVCDKEIHLKGDTHLQFKSGGAIHGETQMVSTSPGQKMHMDMTFDGKRIGSCDYTPSK